LGFRVQAYGMRKHRDLFTRRQLVALSTASDLVSVARDRLAGDGADDVYADAVATYLGIAVSRPANSNCTLAAWSQNPDQTVNAFGRQALPMTWDFPEVNPFAGAAGDFAVATSAVARCLSFVPWGTTPVVEQLDARHLNGQNRHLVATDPPYYDNI